MPRSQSSDFFHSMKFQVTDSEGYINPVAGFATCTMPEETIEVATYRDGLNTYTKKQLGNPSFNDLTMTKGIVKAESQFSDYIRRAAEGYPVRTDFNINHFHRDDVQGLIEYSNAAPSRIIRCFNALPIRVKFGTDFDSNSSDISIQEIDFAVERSEVIFP